MLYESITLETKDYLPFRFYQRSLKYCRIVSALKRRERDIIKNVWLVVEALYHFVSSNVPNSILFWKCIIDLLASTMTAEYHANGRGKSKFS
jgi:hypothetical protein